MFACLLVASTGDIKVEVERDSCTQATIRWKLTSGRDSEVDITVERVLSSSHTSLLDHTPERVPNAYPIPHVLTRGATYRATVCGVTSGLKGEVTFRAGKKSRCNQPDVIHVVFCDIECVNINI